jgi:undecaprenyl-diphosphatase
MKLKTVAYLLIFIVELLLALAAWHWAILPGDLVVTQAIQNINLPGFEFLMRGVSSIGIPIIIGIGASAIFASLRHYLEIAFVGGSTGLSYLLTLVIKELVHRPRPVSSLVDIYETVGGFSFPSGHVMLSVALYGSLLYFAWKVLKPLGWRITILILLGLLLVSVGISRIYLGAHWLSDVVGAYLFGVTVLATVIWLYNKTKQYLKSTES